MPSISAVILARDNEAEIADCLASAAWADELLVILDSRSKDDTAQAASLAGAKVITHPFVDFSAQRNFALSLAAGDWVFFLDSDERATPEVQQEITSVIGSGSTQVGWWIPRHNHIWGRIIRHGGWYPDYQLRLIKRGHGYYDPTRRVHEVVLLDGAEGHLQHPLIHYNYSTIRQFIAKQQPYAVYEAEIRFKQGIRPKPWTWLSQSLREFSRRYIVLQGFRDGWRGLVLCVLVAYFYGYRVTRILSRLVTNAQNIEKKR